MKEYPLGIEPRVIWKSKRINDILDAMERYATAKVPIPVEWVEELKDLAITRNS